MQKSVQTVAAVAHGLAGQALGTLQHSPTQARHNSPPPPLIENVRPSCLGAAEALEFCFVLEPRQPSKPTS